MKRETESEERKLKLEKESALKKLGQQLREEKEEEEKRMRRDAEDALNKLRRRLETENRQQEAAMRSVETKNSLIFLFFILYLRADMNSQLAKLRTEVNELKRDEEKKLNAEKDGVLKNIKAQVGDGDILVERCVHVWSTAVTSLHFVSFSVNCRSENLRESISQSWKVIRKIAWRSFRND